MSDTEFPIEHLLHAAAAGKPEELACWIEVNKTLEGIPIELIAELIRNSKGCHKVIAIPVVTHIKYATEEIDGQLETYPAIQSGYVRKFPSIAKIKGRPFDPAIKRRNLKMLRLYRHLSSKMGREAALTRLSKKHKISIQSIEDILKAQRKGSNGLAEILRNLNRISPS